MKTRTFLLTTITLLVNGVLHAQTAVGLKAPPTGPPPTKIAPTGPQQPAGPINPGSTQAPQGTLTGNQPQLPDGILFVNRGSGSMKTQMNVNDEKMILEYGPKKIDPSAPGADADFYEPEGDPNMEPTEPKSFEQKPENTGGTPIPGNIPGPKGPNIRPQGPQGAQGIQTAQKPQPAAPNPKQQLDILQHPNQGAPAKPPVKTGPFQIPDKIRTNPITQMEANNPAPPAPEPVPEPATEPSEPQAPVINDLEEP